jgi:hypothetical protein
MQFLAAGLMLVVILITFLTLAPAPPSLRTPYTKLLASLWTLWVEHRALKIAMIVQGLLAATLGAFSYELGVTKPDPAIYRAVCHDFGVVPGQLFGVGAQVAMIGNSPRCDRDGPRAVGIKGLHLERSSARAIRDLVQFAVLVTE